MINPPIHGINERKFYEIVRLYYLRQLIGQHERRYTQREIAKKYGCSTTRIGQILRKAMAKLRKNKRLKEWVKANQI